MAIRQRKTQARIRSDHYVIVYRVSIPDREPAAYSTWHKIPVQPVENKQEEQVSQINARASEGVLFYLSNRFIPKITVNFHKISVVPLRPLSF